MTKNRETRSKRVIASITILTLLMLMSPMPKLQAASQLTSVSDTIEDSDVSEPTILHTFGFTTITAIPQDGYFTVEFAAGFDLTGVTTSSDVTCPNAGVASISSQVLTCTYGGGSMGAGAKTLTVDNVDNPGSAASYVMLLNTYSDLAVLLDTGECRVAIIEDVTVTAHVGATLTFTIVGVDEGTLVESATTNATSTATTVEFGTIDPNTQYIVAQKLEVSTNADAGFSVKVWQDNNLQNAMSNDIDKFADGSTSTPAHWAAPTETVDAEETYGHFGIRSDDDDVALAFSTSSWVGFYGDGTGFQHEVFTHDGPSKAETENKGWAYVQYSIEVSNLQEAGDYTNTLTYICTPTY